MFCFTLKGAKGFIVLGGQPGGQTSGQPATGLVIRSSESVNRMRGLTKSLGNYRIGQNTTNLRKDLDGQKVIFVSSGNRPSFDHLDTYECYVSSRRASSAAKY